MLEFGGRDFTKPFEPRDFAALAQLGGRGVALGFRIAIDRLLFVPHAEERRLEHKQVAVVHEVVEEAEEISDEQIANVQAVDIGVGG